MIKECWKKKEKETRGTHCEKLQRKTINEEIEGSRRIK